MKSFKTRFQMMGTFIDLVVYHPNGEQLIKDAYLQLHQYAQRFTVNQADSELMSVNKSSGIQPVNVQSDLFDLIKKAKEISIDASNPFNIAIGPLVKSWRIGFKDAALPTQQVIDNKLFLVDSNNIILDEKACSVYLSKPNMEIDLGAIAKGYFADQVKQNLINAGVRHGLINLGGNVLTIGGSPDNPNATWNVGIQNPLSERGEACRVVPLQDMSMVTSGVNERYFQLNGQRYHHLLDAKTGTPISTNIASVTIISKYSVDGEIWSTAGFLSSVEEGITYLNQQANIEAVVISDKGRVHTTQGLMDDGKSIYINKSFKSM